MRWHFGSFTVWEAQRRIDRGGAAIRVGPRSFDLLLRLLKQRGEFVTKEELLSTVWAGVVVEEGSVRVHMSALRKALGSPAEEDGCKEWISNVPHRGYRFNGRLRREVADATAGNPPRPAPPAFAKLPVRLTELVGRESEVEEVLASVSAHRLVTIVGPGGIGKTSVAVRAAELIQERGAGTEVAFVDLAPLISPGHVLGTMARSLGAPADMPDTLQAIARALMGRQVLVLIDNCEHLLDALAVPVARLLAALEGLRILATSREPLRIPGEYVRRLSPLAVPDGERVSLREAMRWPAVRLLVERAAAAGAAAFNDDHGSLLARLTRRLDGIPLAIELVAARLANQSASEMVPRLDDHMRLHSAGNRAAFARHRTLAAALEWSIALLSGEELRLFRRLSVFRGRFDVEAALRVNVDIDPDTAFDALISLANKSLVFFDGNESIAPYRMLDTTRSYGATLLEESGERPESLRRHALLMLDTMKAATAELPGMTEQDWGDHYGFRLNDLRFALEVCLTQQPDARMAAALVIASTPLWFHVSQVDEYRAVAGAALRLVDRQPQPDEEAAAWLSCAVAGALLHTAAPVPDLMAASNRALEGALLTDVRMLQLQARWGHCTHDVFRGEYSAALANGQALLELAQSWDDPDATVIAHRVVAIAAHFCAELELSRRNSEAAIAEAGAGRMRANMFQVDGIVAAKTVLARTLWLQGETARALQMAKEALERAEATGNSVTLCQALFGAAPVALWSGEIVLASKWVPRMLEEAQRRGLAGWYRYADWFLQGLEVATATQPTLHVRSVAEQLGTYDAPRKEMLVTFCLDWLDDAMVERVRSGEGQWSAAEVWRAAGWREEKRGLPGEAERFYLRALQLSREQGALAWELRAVSSLAAMWTRLGRGPEALALIEEICSRAASPEKVGVLAQARELHRKFSPAVPAKTSARRRSG